MTHCSTLQHTATHFNSLQITALEHQHSLQLSAVHRKSINQMSVSYTLFGSILQHTATRCNTPQHTATHRNTQLKQHGCIAYKHRQLFVAHCNTLQHAATHCTTPQHTATQCKTLQHNDCKRALNTQGSFAKKIIDLYY